MVNQYIIKALTQVKYMIRQYFDMAEKSTDFGKRSMPLENYQL